MMGGLEGARRLMENDTSKAGNLGATLGRFGQYFKQHLGYVQLALVLIVGATWAQVQAPEYIGQAIDCYLFPQQASECWFTTVPPDATIETKIAGLGEIVLALLALYVAGAVLTGLTFYVMSVSGQIVLL